jgi:hypothetical protein
MQASNLESQQKLCDAGWKSIFILEFHTHQYRFPFQKRQKWDGARSRENGGLSGSLHPVLLHNIPSRV